MIQNELRNKKVASLLKDLRPKLYGFRNYIHKEKLSKQDMLDFWSYTHTILDGFNLVEEKPGDYDSIIASDCSLIYFFFKKHFPNTDLSYIKEIETICSNIFIEVNKYPITDNSSIPNMIDFYLDKKREPTISVVITCFFLSLIIVGLYGLFWWIWLCWNITNYYSNAVPFFVGLFIALYFTDHFKSYVSTYILLLKWKMFWARFVVPLKIKHYLSKINIKS